MRRRHPAAAAGGSSRVQAAQQQRRRQEHRRLLGRRGAGACHADATAAGQRSPGRCDSRTTACNLKRHNNTSSGFELFTATAWPDSCSHWKHI